MARLPSLRSHRMKAIISAAPATSPIEAIGVSANFSDHKVSP